MHTEWVETAAGQVECEEGVEMSPLVSYAGALYNTPDRMIV